MDFVNFYKSKEKGDCIMKRKVIAPIILTIGLGSMVVLGSSPEMVGNFLESIKNNSMTRGLFSPSQSEIRKANIEFAEKTQRNENVKIPSVTKNVSENREVSDEIVYFILFNHLVGLKQQAQQETTEGETPVNYIELYKEQAFLTDEQSQFLFQNAQDCIDAVKPIDTQAKDIITRARADYPNGELRSPDDVPVMPRELNDLQEQKNQTILNYRDVLKNFLGESKFAQFDEFARGKIVPQVTTNLVLKEVK